MKLHSFLKIDIRNLPLFYFTWMWVEVTVILLIGMVFFPPEPIEDDDSEYEIYEDDSDEEEEADYDIEELTLRERLQSLPIVQCIHRVYLPTQSLFVNSIGQIVIHLFSIMIAMDLHKFLDVAISSFFWNIKIKNHKDYAEIFDGLQL
ncbi:hypothetical protein PRIPAC_97462 [Pristionchus pacificus]|uniref:Uncharacterized protein n=1 Tax=Pristionchus pacificus TaxID=54126 RepID=A0A2A6D0D7_PRIPA|nr:hypothetical protein PRIPAC_97462 [Pristionchus pacificus]|eukprot:PDM83942.1 hypothetical protein PRIPAC_34134 [Pristionchus pacificus]